jgi:hypothetical protein
MQNILSVGDYTKIHTDDPQKFYLISTLTLRKYWYQEAFSTKFFIMKYVSIINSHYVYVETIKN